MYVLWMFRQDEFSKIFAYLYQERGRERARGEIISWEHAWKNGQCMNLTQISTTEYLVREMRHENRVARATRFKLRIT